MLILPRTTFYHFIKDRTMYISYLKYEPIAAMLLFLASYVSANYEFSEEGKEREEDEELVITYNTTNMTADLLDAAAEKI